MNTPRMGGASALATLSLATALGASAVAPTSADAAPSIKVRTSKHVLVGDKVKVKGKVSIASAKRVRVERNKGRGWKTVDVAEVGDSGRFRASFPGRNVGRMKVRVMSAGELSGARRAIVYRRVHASYYGPGLYGNRLACGGRLSRGTVGVAHKSLPCGTKVHLRYRGRHVRVRVIDRGPYVGGRVYDLTEATKDRLGFGSTGRVWSSR